MASSNNRIIFADELMPLIKERLAAGQSVTNIGFKGVSMLPMLRQGKDAVEISPLPEKLKKYDIPVYQMPSGKYIMHRIIKAKEDYYICLGDNRIPYEKIYHSQMIAVVTAFFRDGKRISVDNPIYRAYAWIWVNGRFFRRSWRRIKLFLRRILKWENA